MHYSRIIRCLGALVALLVLISVLFVVAPGHVVGVQAKEPRIGVHHHTRKPTHPTVCMGTPILASGGGPAGTTTNGGTQSIQVGPAITPDVVTPTGTPTYCLVNVN